MSPDFFPEHDAWFLVTRPPMDPEAPETFDAWLQENDGRTLYEFAANAPVPGT